MWEATIKIFALKLRCIFWLVYLLFTLWKKEVWITLYNRWSLWWMFYEMQCSATWKKYTILHIILMENAVLCNEYGWRWVLELGFKEQ